MKTNDEVTIIRYGTLPKELLKTKATVLGLGSEKGTVRILACDGLTYEHPRTKLVVSDEKPFYKHQLGNITLIV